MKTTSPDGLTFHFLLTVFLIPCLSGLFLCTSLSLHAQDLNIDILKKRVEKTGKLEFKKNVPVKYMNSARFKDYLASLFDEENPTGLPGKDGVYLRWMGFENKTIDVRRIRKRLLLSNTSCVYNKKTKEIIASNEYRELDFIHAVFMTHELRHSLQDQYFDLTTLSGNIPVFDDRYLAVTAAIEGDASLVMAKDNGMNVDVLTSTSDADVLLSFSPVAKLSQAAGESPALIYRSIMPYVDGLRFVSTVYNKKKWDGVNKILQNPPDSTEQILHPDKYFKKEKPIDVLITYKPEGYVPYLSGVIGEYMLNILLKPGDSPNEVDFARGWGGDMFCIYKHSSTPSYFLVWKSLWDENEYCSHFYSDFKRFIENRFHVNFKDGNVKGKGMDFTAGRSEPGEDYFFLMKTGNKILYARTDNRNQMNTFIYGGVYD
jgi:hypothetical protein